MPEGLQEAPTLAPLDAPPPPPSPVTGSRFEGARENLILVAVSLLAFAALAVLLEAISVHSNTPNSDGATVILEGQTMANGHLALHGWALSLDSFWTVDAAIYMVVIAIVGVKASLLYVVPALIAAAVIVLGAWIARGGTKGVAGLAGALTVVALLGLPSHALTLFFLQGPLHIATTLWCLIAIVALRRGRFGWGWVIAVVFLAAGTLGDLQTVALGTIPILLAGFIAAARCRKWSSGFPSVSAAVASVVLALVIRELAKAVGTFTLIQANPKASNSVMVSNLSLLGNYFPKLLGAGSNGFGSGGVPFITELTHGIGLIVLLAGVLATLVGLVAGAVRGKGDTDDPKGLWRLDDPIVLAFIGSLVVFIALTVQPLAAYARYLTPAVIFGAILGGRLITRLANRLVGRPDELPRVIPAAAAVVFAAFVLLLAVGAGFIIDQPTNPSEYQLMGTFLAAHHLYQGVGDYWSASIVTVESNDAVNVRAVTQAPSGDLVRYERESDSSWYAGQKFSFVVYNPTLQFGLVNIQTATQTWGRPERSYTIEGLVVLVYRHPFTVSPKGIS